jgi:hypothetical protein
MGPWLPIILGIIEVFPTVLKIVQEVIELLQAHPGEAAHAHAFHSLLLDWETHKDKSALVAGLQGLRDSLAGVV